MPSTALAAVAASVLIACCAPLAAQEAARDFSAAEQLLFMGRQLGNVKPPAVLNYAFRKSGTLEAGFDDRVRLVLKPDPEGRCCAAHTEFLSAARAVQLPDLPAADGNPVILHFLERELREMQRLTKGSQSHFRKRIRMAVYAGASVRDVSLRYRGRDVPGREIVITPFVDDPNRPRYEQLAGKEYRFLLSDAVPGGLYAIRTRVAAADGAAVPLLVEELSIDGAEQPTKTETR